MEGTSRIAVLIDAENVASVHADEIFTAVDRLGEAFIKRAYGDWSHGNLSGWQSVGRARGVREMQHSPCASGKNATDIALAVDAVDLMHTRDVDVFVIVSGDSDFTPLVTLLREAGRRVHGFGNVQTSDAFRVACGAFVELRQPQSPSVSAAAAKQPAKKAAATKATKAPTKKAATTKPSPQSFSPKVRDKVHAAIKASADAEGWASLSTVAKQLGPGIRPKNFGHATWTKLFTERKGFEVRDAKKPTVAVRSTL